ncbi:MAG: TetR family transcriptional regulator [Polyangia bacterium]
MSRAEQKLRTRSRILDAAGRAFRRGGLGGVGVDGLAKEAGVTSGAFYVHFDSKATAFRESVVQGVADVTAGIKAAQAAHGPKWWPEFVRFYLGERRKCDLSESCGLQSLSAEVARADEASRAGFTAEFEKVCMAIVSGPAADDAPATLPEAHAALATLVGAVTLARAVNDPAIAKGIADAAEGLLLSRPRHAAPADQKRRRSRSG